MVSALASRSKGPWIKSHRISRPWPVGMEKGDASVQIIVFSRLQTGLRISKIIIDIRKEFNDTTTVGMWQVLIRLGMWQVQND